MLTVSRSEQQQSGLPRVQVSAEAGSEVSRPANAACFGPEANFSINSQVSGSQTPSPPRSQRRRGGGGRKTMAPVSDVEVEVSPSVSDGGGRVRRGAGGGGPLSLDDCRCPVCLEIFLEPVTLPCTHTFCKSCFLESVDKATLCCPMCRKRVSTWARLNSRSNTLVNERLWRQIQTAFPQQCQRRLSGQDAAAEDDPGVSVCFPRVSEPGELRKEYQDQISKLTEEKRALDEEERKASEEYIQRLLAEEEELLREERRRREEDERLARSLSNELNSAFVAQENLRPADVTPAKKKEKEKGAVGQIEKFLCPLPSKTSSDCSLMANKENILVSPLKLPAERPLPKLDYYGAQTLGCRPDDRDAETEPPTLRPTSSVEEQQRLCRSHLAGGGGGGGASAAKRKSSEVEDVDEEEEEVVMVTKRGCPSLPSTSSSSSSSSSLEAGGSALLWIGEREAELLSRRQQEEEDRQLALLLQKKLDQEEKQQATDRSKGSADAYLLRQSRRGKAKAGGGGGSSGAQTPGRTSKTTKTSSSSSCSSSSSSVKTLTASSPSSRGSKQTTLTEMFSSLS